MSSRSNGVTNVEFSSWITRWVTASPACSCSRSCAASFSRFDVTCRNSPISSVAETRFWAASTNIGKNRSSRGVRRKRTESPGGLQVTGRYPPVAQNPFGAPSAGAAWSFDQAGDQVLAGPRDPGPDRADRDPAHLGRLRVAQPDQLGEHERVPPVRAERADLLAQCNPLGQVAALGGLRHRRAGVDPRPAAPVPDRVRTGPAGDREQPGLGAGPALERAEGAERPQ